MRRPPFNLNQLVALEALLEEQSVGRAARRAGVTQSAMSHTLRQLRELCGDRLLVRSGNDMMLTPHGERLLPPLRRGLSELEAVVCGRAAFDPSVISGTFTLATYDMVSALVLGPLVRFLGRRAPAARVRIVPVDVDTLALRLAAGDIDAALISPLTPVEGLCTRSTLLSRFAVLCRDGHPAIGKRLTLQTYCRLEHLLVSLGGDDTGHIDEVLAHKGLRRIVRARVPYIVAVPRVLLESDLITTLPKLAAAQLHGGWAGLRMVKPPLPVPEVVTQLVWHPRYDEDPASRFFRDLVVEALPC